MSISEGRISRADLLKIGAVGAVGLTAPGPAFARTVSDRGDHAEHADVVGPLRERPVEGGRQGHRACRAVRRCSATTPTPI